MFVFFCLISIQVELCLLQNQTKNLKCNQMYVQGGKNQNKWKLVPPCIIE